MFGALVRAAPSALFMALLAAVLSKVLSPMIDVMTAADGVTEQSNLVAGLISVSNNALLVGLLALLLTLIARATVEKSLGGV